MSFPITGLPALNQSDDPHAIGLDGLVLGYGSPLDHDRHLVLAVSQRAQQVGVGPLLVDFDLVGVLTDHVDGHAHILGFARADKSVSQPGRLIVLSFDDRPMASNPVEENFVTRFLLGMAVLLAMVLGGGAVGQFFQNAGVPYGDWLGAGLGMIVVFAVFTVLYRRYDAGFGGA